MRLIDTSAWIEWLVGSPAGKAVGNEIPLPEDWLVPTIVQLELSKWLTREVSGDKADQVIAFSRTCFIAPLDTNIALRAAEICANQKLATADAIVYATALDYGGDVITCDGHFSGLPGVKLIPKPAR